MLNLYDIISSIGELLESSFIQQIFIFRALLDLVKLVFDALSFATNTLLLFPPFIGSCVLFVLVIGAVKLVVGR